MSLPTNAEAQLISAPPPKQEVMTRPDRPDSNAGADEIAKWIEEDFDWAVTEGFQNTREEDDKENGG